ncbi:HigA family addiction module antitoxin [Paraburkholderia phenoliruptrix]|uniref:HigA family addiction module antitoxin n=1 Tax=Paraburkholderia phenoliruptrix TaxID=252970 RepID=UPI0001C02DC1|nr:HigA family addiction module antitoxin [Paraburkholderia phenoliruptrix]MDR6392243.1 addiction module HigA family antidote [Paraburkholderia phenoliruptrix]
MDKDRERFEAALLRSVNDMKSTEAARPVNGMREVHPGEILREEFLVPLGMSASTLARALKVSISNLDDVVNERRPVTAELALRLSRYFGGSAESWLNMQQAHDLKIARRAHGQRIESEIVPHNAEEPGR